MVANLRYKKNNDKMRVVTLCWCQGQVVIALFARCGSACLAILEEVWRIMLRKWGTMSWASNNNLYEEHSLMQMEVKLIHHPLCTINGKGGCVWLDSQTPHTYSKSNEPKGRHAKFQENLSWIWNSYMPSTRFISLLALSSIPHSSRLWRQPTRQELYTNCQPIM